MFSGVGNLLNSDGNLLIPQIDGDSVRNKVFIQEQDVIYNDEHQGREDISHLSRISD